MNDKLSILFTNIWLAKRAGSEVVLRDVASGLLRRGHRPIVYSPTLGEVAAELRSKGIVVIDDLRNLGEAPDIIHAHHTIPCGEALIRFPQVPAIYVCHAFAFWMEAPLHFPQIGAYIAVDEACRDRLVHAEGIDPARVLMLPNAVDLRRIPARPRPIMERPQRAVAFGKAAAVPELRAACDQLGIEFSAIGYPVDRVIDCPEHELVKHDLVFGSARAALEALCCGCAVMVCDARGIGGLVTSDNFESFRTRNFGLRTLAEPITVERCIQEIQRYNRADAVNVSERARHAADLEKLLDDFEKLYSEVLKGSRKPLITPEAHERAMARFLHENLPRQPNDTKWPWISRQEELQSCIETLEGRLVEMSDRLTKAERAGNETRRELDGRLANSLQHLRESEQAKDAVRADYEARLDESSGRAAKAEQARDAARSELEVRIAEAFDRIAKAEQSKDAMRFEFEARLAEAADRVAKAEQARNEIRAELEHKLAAASTLAAKAETVQVELRRELEAQHAASSQRSAEANRQLEIARRSADAASCEIANLKRSRLLAFGRFLRRVSGRPVPY